MMHTRCKWEISTSRDGLTLKADGGYLSPKAAVDIATSLLEWAKWERRNRELAATRSKARS
jgi:hypothetical protein